MNPTTMKYFKIIAIKLSSIIFILTLISCNNKQDDKTFTNSDSLAKYAYKILIDESIYTLLKPVIEGYINKTRMDIIFNKADAFDVMKELLSGKAQAIFIARNYTQREDSLLKAYNINTHINTSIAKDALVFFVRLEFPLESLSHKQLISILTDENSSLKKYFPKIKFEPEFICNSILSSEYENLKTIVLNNKPLKKHLIYKENSDSVINEVLKNQNSIGIGYLSKVLSYPDLKPIQISFEDSTGSQIGPVIVHQANIVLGKYPYVVGINIFVLDEKDENSMKLFRYVSKHPDVQKYFQKVGIVPTFAKIVLYE